MERASLIAAQALIVAGQRAGGGRGCALVGRSPSLTDAEAAFLEHHQATPDALQVHAGRGPQQSFLPLPTGRFAFTRWVRGAVDGAAVPGVVVHALVLGRDLLDALDGEPRLLAAGSRIELVESEDAAGATGELAFAALGRMALARCQVGRSSLPELRIVPPSDPRPRVEALCREQLALLHASELRPAVLDWVEWALGHLASGRRILLPDAPAYQVFARVIWLALPAADRRACAWSTHFAATASSVLDIAHAPDIEAALAVCDDPSHWALPNTPAPEGAAAPLASYVAQLVAAADCDGLVRLHGADSDPEPSAVPLSLLRGPDVLARWVAWSALVEEAERAPTLETLEQLLVQSQPPMGGGGVGVWVDRSVLIRVVCRMIAARAAVMAVPLPAVLECLKRHRVLEALAGFPGVRLADPRRHGPAVMLAYLMLLRAGLDAGCLGFEQLSGAWVWMRRRFSLVALSYALGELGRRTLVGIALLMKDAEPAARALGGELSRWLETDDALLRLALEQTEEAPDLAHAAPSWVLERALRPGSPLRRRALELLMRRAADTSELSAETCERIQQALLEDPTAYAHALAEWPADTAARLADGWHRALQVEHPAAVVIAAELSAAERLPASVRPHLPGLTALLAGRGQPPSTWLGFALAEARARDAAGREALALPHSADLADGARPVHIERLLGALATDASHGVCGPSLAALVERMGKALAYDVLAAERALRAVCAVPELDVSCWGLVVTSVTRSLSAWAERTPRDGSDDVAADAPVSSDDAARLASALRAVWVGALAPRPFAQPPPGLLEAIDRVEHAELGAVVDAWSQALPSRVPGPAISRIVERLAVRIAGDPRATQALHLAHLRHQQLHCGLATRAALWQVAALAARDPAADLARGLTRQLLGADLAAAQVALALALDPAVPESIKAVLEQDLIEPHAGRGELAWPGVAVLAARGSLLLTAADDLGRAAATRPERAVDFMREAVELRRADALGVLLAAAARARAERGLLRGLLRSGDAWLLLRMRDLAREPAGRTWLARASAGVERLARRATRVVSRRGLEAGYM